MPADVGVPVAVGAADADALATGEVLTQRSDLVRAEMRPMRPRPVKPTRRLVEGDVVDGFVAFGHGQPLRNPAAVARAFSLWGSAVEASESERVGDDRDAGEGHGCAGEHWVEQSEGGDGDGGRVVGEGPEQVLLDGAVGPP